MTDNSSSQKQIEGNNAEKEDKRCVHDKYSFVNTSGPSADGIQECFLGKYVCDSCEKLLADCESSISGTFNKIYDENWAEKNGIRFME